MSGFRRRLEFLDEATIVLAEEPLRAGKFVSIASRNVVLTAILSLILISGFVYDARYVEESESCRKPEEFFEDLEYVLADTAYTISETIITPFKRPNSLRPENAALNQILSSVRVKVEHAIGF